MKYTLLLGLGCIMLLAVAGCSRENRSSESQSPADQNAGVFPGLPGQGVEAPPVSEWAKVKIDATGSVFVNKKQMALDEFSTECARLKEVTGAIVVFVETPENRTLSPAQADVMRRIVDAGVPMKAAMTESDLD